MIRLFNWVSWATVQHRNVEHSRGLKMKVEAALHHDTIVEPNPVQLAFGHLINHVNWVHKINHQPRDPNQDLFTSSLHFATRTSSKINLSGCPCNLVMFYWALEPLEQEADIFDDGSIVYSNECCISILNDREIWKEEKTLLRENQRKQKSWEGEKRCEDYKGLLVNVYIGSIVNHVVMLRLGRRSHPKSSSSNFRGQTLILMKLKWILVNQLLLH